MSAKPRWGRKVSFFTYVFEIRENMASKIHPHHFKMIKSKKNHIVCINIFPMDILKAQQGRNLVELRILPEIKSRLFQSTIRGVAPKSVFICLKLNAPFHVLNPSFVGLSAEVPWDQERDEKKNKGIKNMVAGAKHRIPFRWIVEELGRSSVGHNPGGRRNSDPQCPRSPHAHPMSTP